MNPHNNLILKVCCSVVLLRSQRDYHSIIFPTCSECHSYQLTLTVTAIYLLICVASLSWKWRPGCVPWVFSVELKPQLHAFASRSPFGALSRSRCTTSGTVSSASCTLHKACQATPWTQSRCPARYRWFSGQGNSANMAGSSLDKVWNKTLYPLTSRKYSSSGSLRASASHF